MEYITTPRHEVLILLWVWRKWEILRLEQESNPRRQHPRPVRFADVTNIPTPTCRYSSLPERPTRAQPTTIPSIYIWRWMATNYPYCIQHVYFWRETGVVSVDATCGAPPAHLWTKSQTAPTSSRWHSRRFQNHSVSSSWSGMTSSAAVLKRHPIQPNLGIYVLRLCDFWASSLYYCHL